MKNSIITHRKQHEQSPVPDMKVLVNTLPGPERLISKAFLALLVGALVGTLCFLGYLAWNQMFRPIGPIG